MLSRAGCDVAAGRLAAAERILAGFDGSELDAAERVTWLNNRACVARVCWTAGTSGRSATALIALGRFDDAIGVLEAMRKGGELSPALEAMRCRELARAWDEKGQPDYAADYRDRARLVAR